jgi:hypothetical protein
MDKKEENEIVTFGPKKPDDRMLSAWAWGTGSAEEFQGYERYEVWEERGNNTRANYLRRKDILKRVGMETEREDTVGHLLQYHLWPGPRGEDMPPVAILGTEKEARLMQELRSLEEAEDPRVRLGHLKEICRTKRKIGQALQDKMNENDAWMHQDIQFWWDENQRHRLWMQLDDSLMELATDLQSEQMDRTALMSMYNWHAHIVQTYLDRTGPYEMPIYDEKEA